MLLPYLNKDLIEAGCDEAGRGCLAGAVYAAAVILPKDFKNELLNDSKQLTEHQRYALREVIEKEALAWAVGIVSPEEIDKINILNASFLAPALVYQNIASFTAIETTAATRASIPGTASAESSCTVIFSTADQPIKRPVAARIVAKRIAATHSMRSCPYGCSLSDSFPDSRIPIITTIVLNTSDAE